MIINNKRVQGLYLYDNSSRSIEFTKGDLVVSGDSIYVCDAESVSGINPAEDTYYEYYHPYPGSKIATASEYFQYIKSGEDEGLNKYVSCQALKGILQGYQFGLNMEGEIEDWIDGNGQTSLSLSSISDRPLDDLMLTETLNRGIIKVSHRLGQIASGTVNGNPFSTLFGFVDKVDAKTGLPIEYQLVLSQYTYKQSDTLYIRVQELMSPLAGVSVYRYMYWDIDNFPVGGNIISSWRNVFSYSTVIQSKLDTINQYYETIESQYSAKVRALQGSFRFKEVATSGSSITNLGVGVYTVCLKGTVDGLVYSESVTVRLVRGSSEYDIHFNKLEGNLHITPSSISLECSPNQTEIISVYGRDVL